jgi:hypothetical protein
MESELLFNRRGSLYFCTTVYRKEGTIESPLEIEGLGVYSINKQGVSGKSFSTRAYAAS